MAKGVKGVNVEKEKEEEKGKSHLLRRQFDDQRYVAGDADRPKKTVGAPAEPRRKSTFGEKWKTYWSAVRRMLLPMCVVLLILLLLYLLLIFIF